MGTLALCCLLFIGSLHPLLSLPVADSREASLQPPVTEEDARLAVEELQRASLLRALWQAMGSQAGQGPQEADPRTDIPNPRGDLRKAFSGQVSNTVLSQLVARTRKQHKQQGTASDCFWKYCI
uniref:Urotensin-2 n=1 Tax=Jaculus jaculus TaxID=51337 RepID=A0A8C5KRE1_JACJA|nr:urotensin-2 [Jaculus jaculus]